MPSLRPEISILMQFTFVYRRISLYAACRYTILADLENTPYNKMLVRPRQIYHEGPVREGGRL